MKPGKGYNIIEGQTKRKNAEKDGGKFDYLN